jgi:PPOX class probable F420-dependent enzyme
MALDEDTVRLAKGPNLATIVTLMPDGRPQAMLRWIDTDGENLLVNTEPQRQAARNAARDQRVTVLIHNAENPWDWAEVRGDVTRTVEGDEARAHIDELSRKYTGADYRNPIGPSGRVILVIAPKKVTTPVTLFGRRH